MVTCMTMTAGNVTVEQAENIAQRFLNEHRPSGRSQSMRMAKRQALPVQVAADATAYYVFNVGTDNGFVIVSGSDLAPKVLGYAMQGSFRQEDIPANMQAWLDGYTEQIAYLERTGGKYEAPRLALSGEPIDKLLKTTWGQGSPYNNSCPMDPVKNSRSVTGCAATALAQVMNYHQYPTDTIAPIPGYTTYTRGIEMPATDSTAIDWSKMRNNYSGFPTNAQKKAVATLMLLCGQALEMDYTSEGSGANDILAVRALRQYFGYDKTVRALYRNNFSTLAWESLIYEELAAGRPVLYGGQSMGGGHAFVIDGYDGEGLFHVNWGWNGQDDNFFRLSVLNPYNTSADGASSTDDGFSFDQDAIVGIQHSTEEIIPERLAVEMIDNTGKDTYTRTSSTKNFTGLSMKVKAFNMTGETHSFELGLALYNSEGEWLSKLKSSNWGSLTYLRGGTMTFSSISFGKQLDDGDYFIVPVSKSEGSEDWEPCWGSNVHRIKATISGNTLTLTEPNINLSGTIETQGGAVNTSVIVSAQIVNNGSYFNDYVYLRVGNTVVGGRIFEAEEGDTVHFEIDFVPTTTGNKSVALAYMEGEEYVPFATGTIKINSANTIALNYTIEATNAEEDVVKADSVTAVVNVWNNGKKFDDDVTLGLFLYNPEDEIFYLTDAASQHLTLGSGEHTELNFGFSNLENHQSYLLAFNYKKGDNEWSDEIYAFFETQYEVEVLLSGTIALTNGNSEGVLEDTTAVLQADVTNTSSVDLTQIPVVMELYKQVDSLYIYQISDTCYIDIPVGETVTFTSTFDSLEYNSYYAVRLMYSVDGNEWVVIEGSELFFSVPDAPITIGDINGDGLVDVSDYIGIANHILGQTPEGFNEQAADVDENGVIDVSDYIGVANIILTGSIYGNQQQSRISRHGDRE